MLRRFGAPPEPGRRYTRRIGAYAVVTLGDGLLLTFQAEPHFEVQLPGGGVDPGESPTRALHREVMEETGWRIADPRRLGAFRRYAYMPDYDLWAEKICLIYAARAVTRHGAPTEQGHTAVTMGWDEAIESLAVEGDRHFALAHARRIGVL